MAYRIRGRRRRRSHRGRGRRMRRVFARRAGIRM